MIETVKSYHYDGVLRFPLMPGTQETAWAYVFDWAIAGEALHCGPDDLVLEFGAGPCYASEWLNRLGYRTVALDSNWEILSFAQDRLALDRRVLPHRSHFVAGDGLRLPFADGTFNGVICLNALHHMPDYAVALSEIRRITRAGGRVVFSEPGSQHATHPAARIGAQEFGDTEKSIVLEEIHRLALSIGFDRMLLKPYVYPRFVALDYRDLDAYRQHRAVSPFTQPGQIADFLTHLHTVFVLTVPGERPTTSVRPACLQAQVQVNRLSRVMRAGQEITVQARIKNVGDTLWLCRSREYGGGVALGIKLCLPGGRWIHWQRNDSAGSVAPTETLSPTLQTPWFTGAFETIALPQDVAPGEQVQIRGKVRLPDNLPTGRYLLRFDMVDEQVAWFSQYGAPVIDHTFILWRPWRWWRN